MAQLVQASVRMPYKTGLPGDVVVNDFSLLCDDFATTDFAAVALDIANFYNAVPSGTARSIANYMSTFFDRGTNKCSIQFREVNVTTGHLTPGSSPIPFTLGPIGAGLTEIDLPLETAVCVTWVSVDEGEAVTGRRRGRNYLGPFNIACLLELSSGAPAVSTDLTSVISASAHELLVALLADHAPLEVWSRANHDNHRVESGWVDNEFDTQRRRQSVATARTLFTLA